LYSGWLKEASVLNTHPQNDGDNKECRKHVKFFMYQVREVKGKAFKTVKLFIFPHNVHTKAEQHYVPIALSFLFGLTSKDRKK
jgi:hypothetical protein